MSELFHPSTLSAEEKLSRLFVARYGAVAEMVKLPGAASARSYWRMAAPGGQTAIGVAGDDTAENRSFVALDCLFANHGIPVAEVIAVAPDFSAYLEEDLGDSSLFTLLRADSVDALVGECMRSLADMQTLSESLWRPLVKTADFGRRQVMWDLNYFKYEFVKPAGISFDENLLEDDFERFAGKMSHCEPRCWGFMMRDCQSRNVMVKDGRPYWIDFQGGMYGPSLYDAVSFLWQAKAGFSSEFRQRHLNIYADAYCSRRPISKDELLKSLPDMALFRTLQVLGAYGLRGIVERKSHFLSSIGAALGNLDGLLRQGVLAAYPELEHVARRLCGLDEFKPEGRQHLRLTVFSFSYKKGYPADFSGNGGGFMFDCRAMHNPGRYAEYKNLTGLDQPVIDFLEDRGEVQQFLENALPMVERAVERYVARGFTSLQVGFGCTGGQHRSVYCAEHLARAIAEEHPEVEVELVHRERGLTRLLNARHVSESEA